MTLIPLRINCAAATPALIWYFLFLEKRLQFSYYVLLYLNFMLIANHFAINYQSFLQVEFILETLDSL